MTSYPLTDFRTRTKILIKASDPADDLEDDEIDDRIKGALSAYGHDVPNEVTEDEPGDGGRYYATSGLASWVEDFSRVIQIEYPAPDVSSNETPIYLSEDDYDADYWDGVTRYIYFKNVSPSTGESFRVRYTAPYTFSGDPETVAIPQEHFEAVCNLAACKCCRAISAKYSRIGDGFTNADSAAHSTKAQEFANRATDYCATYRDLVNLPPTGAATTTKASSAFARWETYPEWQSGRRYRFHNRRR